MEWTPFHKVSQSLAGRAVAENSEDGSWRESHYRRFDDYPKRETIRGEMSRLEFVAGKKSAGDVDLAVVTNAACHGILGMLCCRPDKTVKSFRHGKCRENTNPKRQRGNTDLDRASLALRVSNKASFYNKAQLQKAPASHILRDLAGAF